MLQLKGKYNQAKIMLKDWSDLDEATTTQIYSFLNSPYFKGEEIIIMPDCHMGKGSCIGFTQKLGNYIIPQVVGVDIGCGMLSFNIGNIDINLQDFDKTIREIIPIGFSIHNKLSFQKANDAFTENLDKVCKELKMDTDQIHRAYYSIGTLGGGNHFIELGVDANHDKWITIHTGSRNFGLQVATFHTNISKKFNGALLKDSEEGQAYLRDMQVAQEYAVQNRKQIYSLIKKNFGFKIKDKIECVHNYISFEDNIIRKGAISAHENEKVIIPFNMRDGLIIGMGKGNSKWNNSAPHGAGRLFSRSGAKNNFTLDQFKKEMNGIYSTSVNKSTLDESPMAYKNSEMITKLIVDTVDIIQFVKPIYNLKA